MSLSLLTLSLFLAACTSFRGQKQVPCADDSERSQTRSNELKEIAAADQKDRDDFFEQTSEGLRNLSARDSQRRQRVGEIFREGCFITAQDFAAGALVFQHGDAPEHYLQAFHWANRAADLGDNSQRQLATSAIDRYLIARGRRQLFASQAHKANLSKDGCWCLRQVEMSYPDEKRKTITGRTLFEARKWIQKLNHARHCPSTDCEENLEPSPEGSVPGLW